MAGQSTGINFYVSMDVDGVQVKIGGQRGATLNRSADTTDRTTKDTEGWKSNGQSFKEWSIEADGLLIESDAGFLALEDAFDEGLEVDVELITASGSRYYGKAIVTDLPIEAPHDDEATYSVTFLGQGKLNKGTVTP